MRRRENISRKLQPLLRRVDIARKLDSSAVVSPGSAKDVARFVCRYSGQIKVIRIDALDLVDGLSCHSDD